LSTAVAALHTTSSSVLITTAHDLAKSAGSPQEVRKQRTRANSSKRHMGRSDQVQGTNSQVTEVPLFTFGMKPKVTMAIL
jgi:hypothetical protein